MSVISIQRTRLRGPAMVEELQRSLGETTSRLGITELWEQAWQTAVNLGVPASLKNVVRHAFRE